MRTTVGPLPPAVYWRRRLVVLGGVALLVLVLAMSCGGGAGDNRQATSTGNGGGVAVAPGPSNGSGLLTPQTDTPSFVQSKPVADPGQAVGANVPAGQSDATDGSGVGTGAAGNTCTDAEMSLLPVPTTTAARAGTPIDIHFKIKNIGTRTCLRDVGADLQEIYIKQGAVKIWSSDVCGLAHGNSVRAFAPNAERDFEVLWNGHESTRCAGGEAIGPPPPAGLYGIFGRLGTAVSAPVSLTLTA